MQTYQSTFDFTGMPTFLATSRKLNIYKLELNLWGNPTGRSAKAPEKGTDECPKTELTGEKFCYKRKKKLS